MMGNNRIQKTRPNFKLVFFKFYLITVIPVLIIQCFRFLSYNQSITMLLVLGAMLILSLISLFIITRYNYFDITVALYCGAWVLAFCVFWLCTNGMSGPAAYAYFAFFVVFTIILPTGIRVYFLAVFCIMSLLLTAFYPQGFILESNNIGTAYYKQLSIDYILVSIFVGVTMVTLKLKYEYERNSQVKATKELEDLTNQLSKQRTKLNMQQDEYQNMTNNLEALVQERTKELSKKNSQLHQLAYDNAHHIRGPLCNIQGVITLLKSDLSFQNSQKELDEISDQTNKLNDLTQEINSILR